MDMKYKIKTKIFAIALIIIAFSSFTYVDNYFEIAKNIEIFTSLYKELNTFYVDETKPGELMKTGIDAMLKSLDPYTVYYPESRIEDYRFLTTGKYGGIGITSHFNQENEFVITEVYQGFPGDKAGLKPGDIVREIDQKTFEDKTPDEIGDLIKGQAGTELSLNIFRKGENRTFEANVTREDVEIPSVPFYGMIDDKIGYVKLSKFTKTASKDVRNAIKDLKNSQGMEELVLDLRYNGGGLLREAINIVNFFVPKETLVVKTKGKIDSWNKTYVTLSEPLIPQMKVAVLINGRSASASEIVSGSLQDLDRAVVVGVQSFGKGLVQQTKSIAYNSKFKLTVAKYYTPSGRCIQKLDYSHKKDGVAKAIDEQNINAFETANGRTVYDGKGITPDVFVKTGEESKIYNGLVKEHIIFDFATNYYYNHDSIVAPADFRLTDAEYAEFVSFAKNSDFEYKTQTEELLTQLIEASVEENYFDDAEDTFSQLRTEIAPDVNRDLTKFQSHIKKRVEAEIVSRYYYQDGKVRNELAKDEYLTKVAEIFDTNYSQILKGK